jgi:hypothetical protein
MDATAPLTSNHQPGDTFPLGTTKVTYTAKDASGNTSTCCFNVTVIDDTPPVPDVATLSPVTGQCSATVTAAPTATDNCAGKVTGATSDPLTYSAQGTYTVHWIYSDGNGNSKPQNQTVTVKDTTPPIITCPPSITAASCSYSYVPVATASDNCTVSEIAWAVDGGASNNLALGPPPTLGIGCHTVWWIAYDGANPPNTQACPQSVHVNSNLKLNYIGDTMVFTANSNTFSASVSLTVQVAPLSGNPCVTDPTTLRVRFEVWSTATLTPAIVGSPMTAPVNANWTAGVLTTLACGTATPAAVSYEIRAYLVDASGCDIAAQGGDGAQQGSVTVDLGTAGKRIDGGGWIVNTNSSNGKGTFGFTAGFSSKSKTAPQGNTVFMLHAVPDGNGNFFDWKVKDSSWSSATLSFYHNTTLSGNSTTTIDSARVTTKGVVQQINPVTGQVLAGGFGNATIVFDGFDGDQYSPALKDNCTINIYDANNNLWWGSTGVMLPLGGGGPGGGNIKVFNQ